MTQKLISETRNSEALDGEKAIEALCDYIEELEEERGKRLTDKQTDAIIRLANELICSIKSDRRGCLREGDLILHARMVRAQLRAHATLSRPQLQRERSI